MNTICNRINREIMKNRILDYRLRLRNPLFWMVIFYSEPSHSSYEMGKIINLLGFNQFNWRETS